MTVFAQMYVCVPPMPGAGGGQKRVSIKGINQIYWNWS